MRSLRKVRECVVKSRMCSSDSDTGKSVVMCCWGVGGSVGVKLDDADWLSRLRCSYVPLNRTFQ